MKPLNEFSSIKIKFYYRLSYSIRNSDVEWSLHGVQVPYNLLMRIIINITFDSHIKYRMK